jgi:phytoene dehydrogenase-like protein
VTSSATDAIVVGSGPNGLAAAVALAQAGVSVTVLEGADTIGGGTRSAELTVPGVLHDVCSAVHPFAVISPFFASLPLADHGLEWRYPTVDLAHPIDGDRAGVLVRSLDDTVAGLGDDGRAWRRIFAPLVEDFADVVDDLLGPFLHVPRHPVAVARFGLRGLQSASLLARRFHTDEARGMWAGNAAHAFHPLSRPGTAAAGLMLIGAAHSAGWPVPAGGSQRIADALASLLTDMGGKIETGVWVTSLDDLPPGVVLLDIGPKAMLKIAGDRLPVHVRRAYTRFKHGPAAYKVDLAVEDGVPWTAPPCREAGTVHVGGTFEEIAAAEKATYEGRMPERPFVLVGQQYLADPERSAGNVHPIWTYGHVPHGYDGAATDAILDQIERFAPGTRDRIVGMHVSGPQAIEAYNPNYVGGDISTGGNDLRQMVARPRFALDPYATGIPGVFLCSAATAPTAGVHGMCGYHAARSALRYLERQS